MPSEVDLTGVDLKEFAKKVYDLSVPQGFGFLHAVSGSLSDEDAISIVDRFTDSERIALDMDYIRGRACKMTVFKKDGKLFTYIPWYDHTDEQLAKLLEHFAVPAAIFDKVEHGAACNCVKCGKKR